MADDAAMQMPAGPGPEHERLHPFVGTFRAEIRLWFGPGEPMVSTGTMTNTLDLGGRFLRHDYVGDPSDGPFSAFEGRGFWGFNVAAGRYEGIWVDNASTVMQIETGSVDDAGTLWTMHSTVPNPQGDGEIVKRSEIRLIDENRHSMASWFGEGEGAFKTMEIDYVRAD